MKSNNINLKTKIMIYVMLSVTMVMAISSYLIITDVTKESGDLAHEEVMGDTLLMQMILMEK